jgi:hypothetical protein
MPIHDWTRVSAGIFHDFRNAWLVEIRNVLNTGGLPGDFYAQTRRIADEFIPGLRNRALTVHHSSGDRIVAFLEIVSPDDKSARHAFRRLVDRVAGLVGQGYHLLLIDLIPPGPHDPQGIHAAVWEELCGDDYAALPGRPLALGSYEAGYPATAYIEPIAVGDVLPDVPLFLAHGWYVNVPLEATYQAAYRGVPQRWKAVLEAPAA